MHRAMKSYYAYFEKFFIYNLFTKSTDKIQRSYEAAREETREACGCLAVGCNKTIHGCINSLCLVDKHICERL